MEKALIFLIILLVICTIVFLALYVKQKLKVLTAIAKDFNSAESEQSKASNASRYRKVKEDMITVIVGLVVVIGVIVGGAIYICF